MPFKSVDGWAALLSSLCLVHCLALPVVAAILPALAAGLGHDHLLHWGLLALAAPVSLWALGRGWRLHGRAGPALLAAPGLVAMAVGASVEPPLEAALTVGGGLLLAFAHWRNWRALGG